ncbi:unnamed protein product [Periconia digitata]|uniref:DUF7582 domain-containing protein n=1 Tax=Periconia digitata TaxID=1303443 RepID=A0A9W4UDM1_9PLEO|nr:unnamed protein product [Periconia digitata]
MGCSISRPGGDHAASTLLELAPVMTAGNGDPAPELDRNTLLRALANVASYIDSRKANITVVAVGGAVNTIFFQSRQSTHDVDFYNHNLRQSDYELIMKGVKFAQSRDPILQGEWFNNRTILFIPKAQRSYLTEQAISQNEIIFERPGLKIVAAPWNYAICAKLDRCAGAGINGQRPYDYSDAATYLRRYLEMYHLQFVPRSEVWKWAASYSTTVTDGVLGELNAVFKSLYGREPIRMSS